MLRVIEYFAKSLEVIRKCTLERGVSPYWYFVVTMSVNNSIHLPYSILYRFGDKARYWSKIAMFSYPLAFVRRSPVGILPYRLVGKNWLRDVEND